MSRTKKRYRGVDERKLNQGSRAAVLPQVYLKSLMLVVLAEIDSTLNFEDPWGLCKVVPSGMQLKHRQ